MKDIIKNIVEDNGCSLYDIEITTEDDNKYYRIYITKPNDKVSLDDCEKIHRLISPIFDVEEPIDGKYFLEVSSPGIERPLKTIEHFQNSIGENVRIRTKNGDKIKGKLLAVLDDNRINIKNKIINFDDIKSASTYFDWKD